ncbi:MAG: STAS domain-containing protein [Acidimicrobiia bacterium]
MTTWVFDPPTHHRDPGDALDITLRFEGDVTVCALAGRLEAATAPDLDAWLDQLLANGRRQVLVDLRDLDALTAEGLAVVDAHAERFAAAGGHLHVR